MTLTSENPSTVASKAAFHRAVVGLELNRTDYRLLDYVKLFAEEFGLKKGYFIHVAPNLEVPDFALNLSSPDLLPSPLDEKIREEMEEEMRLKLRPGLLEAEFDVLEGKVTDKLLHWVKVKQADLAIVGKKIEKEASGISANRFLRSTQCSVMFVPDQSKGKVTNILVPTDFSEYSDLAIQKALDLARSIGPQTKVTLLHVYSVPTEVHFRASRTYSQYAEMVRHNIAEYFPKYLERFDSKDVRIEADWIENTEISTAWHIMNYAGQNEHDLILIGAVGHSAITSMLLGSVTEKLLALNERIPTLVVRPSMTTEA